MPQPLLPRGCKRLPMVESGTPLAVVYMRSRTSISSAPSCPHIRRISRGPCDILGLFDWPSLTQSVVLSAQLVLSPHVYCPRVRSTHSEFATPGVQPMRLKLKCSSRTS